MTLPPQVLTKKQKAIIDRIVPMALTHPVDEVRWYVVHAVSLIWGTQPNLALRSVQAIAKEAYLLADLHTRESARPYQKRRSYEDMALESATKVRSEFWKPNFMQEQAYDSVQLDEWHGAEAQNKVLTILKAAPSEPLTVKAFRRAAERLVAIWETKHDHDRRRERRIEADLGLADLIEQFVLRAPLEIALITIAPTEQHFDQTFDVNVKGMFFTVQKALPLFKDGGSIILNSSVSNVKGLAGFTAYAASKAAVRNFARGWTMELKDRKIRVNAMSPGAIDTPALATTTGLMSAM